MSGECRYRNHSPQTILHAQKLPHGLDYAFHLQGTLWVVELSTHNEPRFGSITALLKVLYVAMLIVQSGLATVKTALLR
jgi:hypothetical protein